MNTITIPRETFDQMQMALVAMEPHLPFDWAFDSISEYIGRDDYREAVGLAREALSAAKAVSEPKACDMGAMCLDCQPRGKHGECPDQQPQAQGESRSLTLAKQQWESWKQYALELQERLVKYEGGAPMVLNASHPQASEPAWLPIETAPKDGRPVWVKGHNFGDESKGIHCCWAWHDGNNWYEPGTVSSLMMYLVSWMPLPAAPEATK